ncbi:MAG: hypothetical protein AAGE52_16915 [Myxococcota bacterium]
MRETNWRWSAVVSLVVGCGSTAPADTVLPAGSALATPDPELLAQIDEADGVPRSNALLSGFVHGEPVQYWSAGNAIAAPMEGYIPCRREGRGCAPIDHPIVVDTLPGEPGYNAFITLWLAPITDAYDGEVFPSVSSFDTAERQGLIDTPIESFVAVNCPIVHPETEFEDLGPLSTIHARGMALTCAHFGDGFGQLGLGEVPLTSDDRVLIRNVYILQRDGSDEPLSEPLRSVDINGDGDANDSNNIFGVGFEDGDYTPLWQPVRTTVPSETVSIDSDASAPEYSEDDDLFDVDPISYDISPLEVVVDHVFEDDLINCPLYADS